MEIDANAARLYYSWKNLAWKEFPSNEGFAALQNSVGDRTLYEFGWHSSRMTVYRMFEADADEGIGIESLTDYTSLLCSYVFGINYHNALDFDLWWIRFRSYVAPSIM